MEKAYLFLRKLITLGINTLIFFALQDVITSYYLLPILLVIFSLIVSRVSESKPKELYNHKRSEEYFSKGGLRDLLRILVIAFAFAHDIVVWAVWGLYQILILVTETIHYIKEAVFWIFHALIWFIKLLVPFWRMAFRLFIFYCIRWPWWIYRYSFHAVQKTYNWNILKVSAIGSFIALFIIQIFYVLQIINETNWLIYFGFIFALLPISWVFGEISSIRGQKQLFAPFREVRFKMRNGMETVRGLMVFMVAFLLLIIIEFSLNALGLIPNSGIALIGISLNISFIINILLITLTILILFGTLVLPTYRLYNEFNETTFRSVYNLLKHIVKRNLQYIAGFIPSSFFAGITIIPAIALVGFSFLITMGLKDMIITVKINKLIEQQAATQNQIDDYRISKRIDELEYVAKFPRQFFQDVNHRALTKRELDHYKHKKKQLDIDLTKAERAIQDEIEAMTDAIDQIQSRPVVNQTRVDELRVRREYLKKEFEGYKKKINTDIAITNIDIDYAARQDKKLNLLLFISGFFAVVALTLIGAFALGYYGNLFYRTFLFRNDNTPAMWREIILQEQEDSELQPLLSTTLNILLIINIIVLLSMFS